MNLDDIEEKWRRAWEEAKIFEADPIDGKPKILVTFPFPYMNGPLHIGHGFTATRVDVYARFKRLQGYNVLFPWAWHWTGQPIVAAAERLARGDRAMIREFKEIDVVPDDELKKFTDPVYMARYYTDQSRLNIKRLGFSIDWRREFHTTSLEPTFNKFIEWQYERLKEGGYVAKGIHPVVWCPRDQSPTGDHDRLEGEGVTYEDYTLIKFRFDDSYLPAATFRPETIFGVTNLWLNPDSEYVEALIDGESWIVSREAAFKLQEQLRSVEVKKSLKGRELIGKICFEPINRRPLPILPGWFVDPNSGSGVVYSVPAHAPFDWVALRDLKGRSDLLKEFNIDPKVVASIEPISIITTEGFREFPALELVEQMGVRDQQDPKCEEATKILYRREFHTGLLKENCMKFAGMKVSEVKVSLIEEFRSRDIANSMYDLPQPVVCRCTNRCIVKVLGDQWFLKYSDSEWKEKTHQLLDQAKIYPEAARQWFSDVIDWFREWPCARRVGLGTPLPWGEGWIVETLSDSTVYMAFYTIKKHIDRWKISSEQLTKSVFDYIFYGIGDLAEVACESGIESYQLNEMRREFLYWYPVDLRNSAKELLPNHLTFFLFQHAALFPPELWPRAVAVNGMMMLEGMKMSKSKGNVITLKKAIDMHGADVVRATLVSSAEDMDDADWREKNAEDLKMRIRYLTEFVREALDSSKARENNLADKWLLSTFQRRIDSVTSALEVLKTRTAFQTAFFDIWNDIRSYLRRVEEPSRSVLLTIFKDWCKLLTPFIPYVTEEMHHLLGEEGFASTSNWPKSSTDLVDEEAELVEWYVVRLIDDVRSVLKLIKPEKNVINIYTAPEWQAKLLNDMIRFRRSGEDVNQALKSFFAKETGISKAEAASAFQKLMKIINSLGDEVIIKIDKVDLPDEFKILSEAQGFIGREFGCRVQIYRAYTPQLYDPKNRAKASLPTKPALYIE